jgi:hypothetical protein
MGDSARITSVQPLRDMKAALGEFIDAVNVAFANVDAEIGRLSQWLQQERPGYYKHAVRRATDAVTKAKSELSRKQYMRAPEPVSVVEEKKLVEKLKRRLEELERKQDMVRQWGPRFEREAMMYKSSSRALNELVAATLPKAIQRLEKMAQAIEDYVRLQPADASLTPADIAAIEKSIADAGETALTSTVEKYSGLRALALSPEAARELRVSTIATPWTCPGPAAADAATVEKLAICDAPPGSEELVYVAWRSVSCEGIYLLRGLPIVRDDGAASSGWFIGPLDRPEEPGGFVAVSVKELLTGAPGLRPLLSLRVGTLAVVAAGMLRSILDAENREVWQEGIG